MSRQFHLHVHEFGLANMASELLLSLIHICIHLYIYIYVCVYEKADYSLLYLCILHSENIYTAHSGFLCV